ncbi:coiled-coil domain-containing protein 102B-like [Labeo rohita]|uniref:Coiled-coil domain-containing protein 102B-like n=1 Tax=Labeo rohita TaxID=84645 RepID=A0A498N566_LABRO|nr:coiled-coil domain-containing protein 102B-like [Labeo rohita]
MPQTADPIAQGEDVNTWLRGMTESLTPKTFELLLFLIIILILRRLLTHDLSQNNNHEELVKITSSLSYAFTAQLHLSDKHITHLQEELTRAQLRIDKLDVKVQDQLKAPNEREQETTEQVKKLQAALAAAQRDQQQANAAQKDLRQNGRPAITWYITISEDDKHLFINHPERASISRPTVDVNAEVTNDIPLVTITH